jgi:hypothetical protein
VVLVDVVEYVEDVVVMPLVFVEDDEVVVMSGTMYTFIPGVGVDTKIAAKLLYIYIFFIQFLFFL